MIPPGAPVVGNIAGAAETPPAVSVCLQVLQKRSDFLRAARARCRATPGFVLQAFKRPDGEPAPDCIRVGFTCSKKVGNAVARNRAKRRLRALAREILPESGHSGWDYVLIGRATVTAQRPFELMLQDLKSALAETHRQKT